ncbi:MAG: 16S rRNA (cytidine(1402)-2'-O)-methyltransferase [Flavobacteriaceae bacterium]|nr:16S rRNA (cytidine(1402)-2'-O)-methyltransferase [Flavobacteriaceae bacterium]
MKLYLVPTPIGNLEDITLRALRVLKEVDGILAEDTRVTGKLLKHFEVSTPMSPFHQNNEHSKLEYVCGQMEAGKTLALVTDAGTPGISDPGFLLVRECIRKNIPVECLPGATAFVPALVNSGLPSDRFLFEGFLPHKKGRQTRLKELALEEKTIILYESPHRIIKTLKELAEYFGGERQASISRELSKLFEETVRGTLSDLVEHFTKYEPRGEFVLILAGAN